MAKKEDAGKKDAGKTAAPTPGPEPETDQVEPETGTQGPETIETGNLSTAEIETVEELEIVYPKLVSAVRDEVIMQVGKCTLEQVKKNMPDFYQRLVMEIQSKGGPNLNVPGFLLELDDPFAEGTLQQYGNMKGLDGLRLPYVLPFKEKGKGEIHEALWDQKFEASEILKNEFKDLNAYVAFKSRIITQALEFYILVAEGGGDYDRAKAARLAMKKIK